MGNSIEKKNINPRIMEVERLDAGHNCAHRAPVIERLENNMPEPELVFEDIPQYGPCLVVIWRWHDDDGRVRRQEVKRFKLMPWRPSLWERLFGL